MNTKSNKLKNAILALTIATLACCLGATVHAKNPEPKIDVSIRWKSISSEKRKTEFILGLCSDTLYFRTDSPVNYQCYSEGGMTQLNNSLYQLIQSKGLSGIYTDTISPDWICSVAVGAETKLNTDFKKCVPIIKYLQSQSPLLPDLSEEPHKKWRIKPLDNPDYAFRNNKSWREIVLKFFDSLDFSPYQTLVVYDNMTALFTPEFGTTCERELTTEEAGHLKELILRINPLSHYTYIDKGLMDTWAFKIEIDGSLVYSYPAAAPGMPIYDELLDFLMSVSPKPPTFMRTKIESVRKRPTKSNK